MWWLNYNCSGVAECEPLSVHFILRWLIKLLFVNKWIRTGQTDFAFYYCNCFRGAFHGFTPFPSNFSYTWQHFTQLAMFTLNLMAGVVASTWKLLYVFVNSSGNKITGHLSFTFCLLSLAWETRVPKYWCLSLLVPFIYFSFVLFYVF